MAPASTTFNRVQYTETERVRKSESIDTMEAPAVSQPQTAQTAPKVDIIDIRHDAVELSLKDEILKSLKPEEGPKRLPTLLLYDERGLQLFEEVNPLSWVITRKIH